MGFYDDEKDKNPGANDSQGNQGSNNSVPPQNGGTPPQNNGFVPPQYGNIPPQYGNVPPQYNAPPQNNGYVPPGQNNYSGFSQSFNGNNGYAPQNNGYNQPPADQYGVTAMILGILSLVVCVICAFFAISYANKQNAIYPNGYAKAGKICGIIAIIMWVVGILAYIIILAVYGTAILEFYRYSN